MTANLPVTGQDLVEHGTDGPQWWFRAAIAGLLVLIGIMIALASLASAIWGTSAPWTWIGALTGVLVGLLIVFLVLRGVLWRGEGDRHDRLRDRHRRHHGLDESASYSPADEARRRYARGEISQGEYRQIMSDLGEPFGR